MEENLKIVPNPGILACPSCGNQLNLLPLINADDEFVWRCKCSHEWPVGAATEGDEE